MKHIINPFKLLLIIVLTSMLFACNSGSSSSGSSNSEYGTLNVANQSNISRNPLLEISYNTAMLPSSINTDNVKLYKTVNGNNEYINLGNFISSPSSKKFFFSPLTTLDNNTTYYVSINNAENANGIMAIDSTYEFATGISKKPMVDIIIPETNTNVSLSPSIQIIFSQKVQYVNKENITIYKSNINGTRIATTSIIAGNNNVYSFSPEAALTSDTKYFIDLSSNIMNMEDERLDEFVYQFTTSQSNTLSVTMLTPGNNATNVSTTPSMQIKFSQAVNNLTNSNTKLYANSPTGNEIALANFAFDDEKRVFTIDPSTELDESTSYYLVLDDTITDIYGNKLAKTIFSYTTGILDHPSVNIVEPSNNEQNVLLDIGIRLSFSPDIKSSTINTSNVKLKINSPNGANVTLNAPTESNGVFTFTHSEPLLENTTYYVIIESGVTNQDNVPIIPTSFSFKTTNTVVNPNVQIIGYYTNWSTYGNIDNNGANVQPEDIPSEINEIMYAFFQVGQCSTANPIAATEVDPTACDPQLNWNGEKYVEPGIQDWQLHTTDGYSDFNTYNTWAKNGSVPASTPTPTDGGLGNIGKTLKRAKATGAKVIASIGGWTLSAPIGTAVSPSHRTTFVNSIVPFLTSAQNDSGTDKKFDGVDVDWEPNGNNWTLPTTKPWLYVPLTRDDLVNYRVFLSELQALLTAAKNNNLIADDKLSIAMTANPSAIRDVDRVYGAHYWKEIADIGVKLNIMTYDYNAQGWDPICEYTQFNSPLFSDPTHNPCSNTSEWDVSDSVRTLKDAGVPAIQIGIGAPAYGKAYAIDNVSDVTPDNLYVKYNTANESLVWNNEVKDYYATWTNREILTGRAFGGSTASENTRWTTVGSNSNVNQTVATAWVNWTYPAWISYTSYENAIELMKYAKNEGLDSVMLWDISLDVQKGDTNYEGKPLDWNTTSIISGLYQGRK